MTNTPGTNAHQQGGGHANQGGGTAEGLVGQATETVRNAASGASDLARDTYETGARYASDAWDSRPDVGVYVARAAGQDPHVTFPVLALIAAGAVGFLAAYLIQNSGFQRNQAPTREHGRGRNRRHHRNHT